MNFRITTSLTAQEREQWDRFVGQCPYGHSFQSYSWGQFQEALTGRDVFYLIGSQDGQWRAVAQIFRRSWPWPLNHLGNYEISGGPAFLEFEDFFEVLQYLDPWAAQRAVEFHVSPRCETEHYERLFEMCRTFDFRPTSDPKALIYGEETVLVDLRPPAEDIFKTIRYTTRYEIRKAQRAGVTVRFANDTQAIETFYEIYRRQDVRKEISPIDMRYFVLLHKHVLSDPRNGAIAIAELQGQPLSAAICFSFGKIARYRWGASDELHKKELSASHFLHWEMIRHFKEAGCEWYDFSGASPSLPRTYFSYGVNLFKTGFSKHFVKYTPDFMKSYRPLWSTILQWRDAVSGARNRIVGIRPFRALASIRNQVEAQMSSVTLPASKKKTRLWDSWPRAVRVSLAVSLFFLVSAGFVVSRHELWRDEMRPWLVARDSPSTAALINQIRDEGASPLWPLCLRILSRFDLTPGAMQFFNLILGAALIFVFWAYAPFSTLQKLLLTFNYYLFYQYAVVSNHYLLGLLFLALACVFYETRWDRPYRLAAILLLACMSSRNALILSLGMASAFLWDTLNSPEKPKRAGATAMSIFAVTLFLTGAAMRPTLGVPYQPEWYLHWNVHRLLWLADVYAKAFLAFPIPGRPFWVIAHLEHLLLSTKLMIPLAAVLFLSCASIVRLRRDALIYLAVGTSVLLVFFYAGYLGIYRHAGFLFFAFLFAWWLSRGENRWTRPPGFLADSILTGVLVMQMAGGMIAATIDVSSPSSCGKQAAEYISQRGYPETLVSVGNVSLGSPLSGYLDRPIYYAEVKEWASITPWYFQADNKTQDTELVQRSQDEAIRRQMDLLMITDHALTPAIQKAHQFEFQRAFTGSRDGSEDYYLYFRRT